MAFLAVDKDGTEVIFTHKPIRNNIIDEWLIQKVDGSSSALLNEGGIKNLIGYELTWNDEPVELK